MVKIPAIDKKGLKRIIEASSQILLTTHENPDGDGLGSEIAMYHHIHSLEKKCRIINISKLPEKYSFLDQDGIVENYCEDDDLWIKESDLVLIFDIGDSKRVGAMGEKIYDGKTVVSIDHHPVKKDEPYTYSWIDVTAPATGFMVWEYLVNGNYNETLSYSQALPLYVALVTDTGSFRYSNTHAESHLMANQLIRSGVKPHEVNRHVYENRNLNQVKLLGNAINNLNFRYDKKVAWVVFSNETINSLDIKKEHIEGFADFIRSIQYVEVAFVIIEEDNKLRVSFRSQGVYTVNDLATKLGGGGHKYAAGANLDDSNIINIETKILNWLEEKIRDANGD